LALGRFLGDIIERTPCRSLKASVASANWLIHHGKISAAAARPGKPHSAKMVNFNP